MVFVPAVAVTVALALGQNRGGGGTPENVSSIPPAAQVDAVPIACAAGWVLMMVWEVGLILYWKG